MFSERFYVDNKIRMIEINHIVLSSELFIFCLIFLIVAIIPETAYEIERSATTPRSIKTSSGRSVTRLLGRKIQMRSPTAKKHSR